MRSGHIFRNCSAQIRQRRNSEHPEMCGIAGLWRFGGAPAEKLLAGARRMTEAVAYRRPGGDGHWSDANVGVALGHRRLAIIDLSPTGVQPMTSADGRFVIPYNGELYN